MRHGHAKLAICVACVLFAAGLAQADATRPSETYFPNTTAAFVSITFPPKMVEQFKKTQIGELVRDPVMEPFIKDVRRQFEDRIANIEDRLSITTEDLKGVSGGEAALAAIRPGPGVAAAAVMADVSGHVDAAKSLLEKISKDLTGEGAKKTQQSVGDVTVMVFELPEPKGPDHDAEGVEKPKKPAPRQAVYCLVGSLLMASDRLDVIEGMLFRVPKERGDALADSAAFKQVMERCRADAGKETPQARWYIQPLSYIDVLRTGTPPHQRRKGKSMVALVEEQGLSAVQGMGGFLSFASEDTEIIHRTAVFAPKPWEMSMKMLGLQKGDDFSPQPWTPREIATYSTFYFDVLQAFDNFGPLYGEISGLKTPAAWEDAWKSLRDDPNGPQIDLRNDLAAHLGPRITVISDYQVPITPTSERLLFALETRNPSTVAKAIDKMMAAEPGAQRRLVNGQVVWEMVPEEPEGAEAMPVVLLPGIGGDDAKDDEDEERAKLLPHAAVTVAHGHLFCASHIDFLLKVLRSAERPESLEREPGYKAVKEKMATFGIKEQCAGTFSFTDEEFRPTYELIRMNKLPEAETMLARAINSFSGEAKKGQFRKPKIDGSQLPEYDVVRRHLGPAGMVVAVEKDGFFLKGCLLKKP